MDWIALITGVAGAVFGGGGTMVFFRKQTRRAKDLENEKTASEQWKELYEKSEEKREALGAKIEGLYKTNGSLRDINNDLTTQNVVLKIHKCEVKGCDKRVPPRGY